jgi:GntR family transcriptional regulator
MNTGLSPGFITERRVEATPGERGRYIVLMTEVPLYGKVEEVLASEIARGYLKPGDRLPSEEELLTRFGVSRITVRRAIQNLIQRGTVEIRRGHGTYVLAPRISQELTTLTGFVEDMDIHGRKASARVLSQGVVAANAIVARQLGINKGARVMRVERVRLADSVPMSFDETYLPLDIGKKIVSNDLRSKPIFTLLEDKYGIPLTDAEYKMEAAVASAHIAQGLAISEGSAIFRIERTSFTGGGRPIDYEILSYRGDLIRFVTRLARRATKEGTQSKASSPRRR